VINAVLSSRSMKSCLLEWARRCGRVLTVEENSITGGFGSAVLELLARKNLALPVKLLGIEDRFVEQGPRALMLSLCGLDPEGIFQAALSFIAAKMTEGAS